MNSNLESKVERQTLITERMQARGVSTPIPIPPLPDVVAIDRPIEMIAGRAISLCLCASRAEGLDSKVAGCLVADLAVEQYLTSRERDCLQDGRSFSLEEVRLFQWGFEASWALLWILGHIENLADPVSSCEPDKIAALITRYPGVRALAETSCLLPPNVIFEAADFNRSVFQLCLAAPPPYTDIPGGFVAAVAYQRQQAFSWLLDPAGLSWEEVVVDMRLISAQGDGLDK